MHPIRISGGPVELREFAATDVEQSLALVGDDCVTQWLSFDSRSAEAAAAMVAGIVERAQVNPRTEYYLAVTPAGRNEVIGFARLGFNGVQAAKLGYAIRADAWGHGYATAAARALVDFGFRELGLHRISAAIGPDNAASISVIKRLGFELEGRIRDHVWTNEAWRDSELYSVLSHEWAIERAA